MIHFRFTKKKKKKAITSHFLLSKFESIFPFHSESKFHPKSLLEEHSYTDHPYHVLLPIMCASHLDSRDIFIYSLMSKYIKK